jgi:hypothetical protein
LKSRTSAAFAISIAENDEMEEDDDISTDEAKVKDKVEDYNSFTDSK